ncbi:helix-turn-helix domain-containing protein [Neobacillus terrae]|uniref:helix-turn-helix domain-containing protein n=1 Tax=Neobacillus terrae TaxID=3034837 RepID=UPI001408075F|nr:helix-turn-helix transcriptional regulator [Neobacillus terrae]NHM32074.1 helix-turn-helix transcriptional regulator [Neobacillus terrae]
MGNLVKFVGNNIREIRKMKKLTQEELAEKSGLQTSFLAGVERGERNITLETLDKILNGLEEDVKTVFSFNNLVLDEYVSKNEMVGLIVNLLADRKLQDVKLIHKVAKEIFETYSKAKE